MNNTNNSRGIFADKSDVQRAATQLINQKGFASTLEVKNILRSHGFIAFQEDIARFMEMVAYEQKWGWEQRGGYRIYKMTNSNNTSSSNRVSLFSSN